METITRMNKGTHYITELTDGKEIIIPQFWLGKLQSGYSGDAIDIVPGNNFPTLAQFMHAYYGKGSTFNCTKNEKGVYTIKEMTYNNQEFREEINDTATGFWPIIEPTGEWTSSWIIDGKIAENVDNAHLDSLNRLVLNGGRAKPVKLPEDGYVTDFDPETGLPTKTSRFKLFGEDMAYFNNGKGTGPIFIEYVFSNKKSFNIKVVSPHHNDFRIGGRKCYSENPDKTDAAA